MKKLLGVLLAMSLIFSVTACGGATETGSSANAQGVTDTEILVANSSAVSGPFATTGHPLNVGIQAYFDMVNAGGGIDGRTIRFIHTDDEMDPVRARAAFASFAEDEQVFAYVGQFGAAPTAAILEDLMAIGMPAVYFATAIGQLYFENAETLYEGANIFPIQPLYITEGRVMVVRGIADFDAQSMGIIYTSDEAGMDLFRGVQAQANEMGIPLTVQQIAPGASDVSAAVTAINSANVDFIVVAAAQATMPTVVKELAAQNMTVPAITTYINTVITLAEQVADDIDGLFQLYASGWLNYEGERLANLEAASEWLGDYSMNGFAHVGWIGAHFFVEGLRRLEGQPVTWESFRDAMEEAPITIPFGGVVDYANGARMGTQEMSLFEIDMTSPTGWSEVDGLRSFDYLLSQVS
ncbi:MAG: ABC transporter substrate-binding protein [Oscillospiraceae bacterium]|nr:ABC transporter substrate-binding protein [Oscillospiraceae bacterium]